MWHVFPPEIPNPKSLIVILNVVNVQSPFLIIPSLLLKLVGQI